MAEGWISIHRKIFECPLFQNEPYTKMQAWIYLIAQANHTPDYIYIGYEKTLIERGQFHTSIEKLAAAWRWNRKTVMRFLDVLENEKMCLQKRTASGTTLTIVNYDLYQDSGTTKRTSKRTPKGTSDGTTDGTQTIMINNVNNDNKREGTRFIPPTLEEVEAYIKEKHFTINATKFVNHYTANGWIRGKTKMKDWKAAVRYWQTLENEKDEPQKDKFNNFESSQGTDWDAVERNLLQKK